MCQGHPPVETNSVQRWHVTVSLWGGNLQKSKSMARLFLNPSDRSEQFIWLWTGAQPKIASLIDEAIPDFQQSQDILQDVALSCLREFSEYDERPPFVEWALVIARSRIRQAGFIAPPTCPNNKLQDSKEN